MSTMKQLQDEIDRLREQVKLYRFDFLTGMKQRIDFEYEIRVKFDTASFYLVMYDIDGLHATNKAKGHAGGDALIRQVANDTRMQSGACCSYRVGGDEFMVVHNSEPFNANVANSTMAYVESSDYDTVEAMIEAVDKLMYSNKPKNKRKTD